MTSSPVLTAAVALATLLLPAVATAAPPRQRVDTIVQGRRSSTLLRSQVGYADLDLTRKKGEKQLIHRVSNAISRACPSDSVIEKHQCRNEAWIKVRPQIKQALYNARNMDGFVETVSMVIVVPAGETAALAAQRR
ncbi:UrcA family protein [Sphingomonas sp. BN140010]|uniref:UrcA family protein n=1 Tax=Sphingomonas arvum TaxID=2992113 RepID=A0ABT3JGH8_9SPHN|nr:UrcA family protein [Sphingomonas sp. BN140010]MCW3798177.1 UrcA family protein [Sphingomonas sp. BN140010]